MNRCLQLLVTCAMGVLTAGPFVETAVSALTAVVNLQADGYADLPLGK